MARIPDSEVIAIGSSNVDIGDALRTHVRGSVETASGKYLQHLTAASVHFVREGADYRCSVTVQIGSLPRMAAEAQAKDAYLAFNQALDKVAKQMRRAKRAVREDKAVRSDKDIALRDGLTRQPD